MTGTTLPDYVRGYLIAAGAVRAPTDPGGPALVPLWLNPDGGPPAPGEGTDPARVGDPVVAALTWAPETPTARHEGFLAIEHLDLWIRSRTQAQAVAFHHQIRALLHDQRGIDMGGLRVQEALLYQGLSRTGGEPGRHAFKAQYQFWYFAADAAA